MRMKQILIYLMHRQQFSLLSKHKISLAARKESRNLTKLFVLIAIEINEISSIMSCANETAMSGHHNCCVRHALTMLVNHSSPLK